MTLSEPFYGRADVNLAGTFMRGCTALGSCVTRGLGLFALPISESRGARVRLAGAGVTLAHGALSGLQWNVAPSRPSGSQARTRRCRGRLSWVERVPQSPLTCCPGAWQLCGKERAPAPHTTRSSWGPSLARFKSRLAIHRTSGRSLPCCTDWAW